MATIFFIDDDFASGLIVDNLRQRGNDVHRMSSANEALGEISRIVTADLVVLDLIMPHFGDLAQESPDGPRSSGMRIYRELRRKRADLPILVFTANQDPALIDVIEADPHARYVSRWSSPRFRDFIAMIHRMLGVAPEDPPQRAFIVHGHDDKTKLEVKNYLQNTLGLPEPIILHEQPNLGRTLIEKFEDLATEVSLAFIILTPDDPFSNPHDPDADKRRARQNVILELGFFLGLLGRRSGRIFLLHKGPLDLPSDLSGLVYIDITAGISTASEQIRREIAALPRQ